MSIHKRVGFVDYNLDNYHANIYLAALRNDLNIRGYTVAGCTALQSVEGRQWAQTNEIPYYDDFVALDRAVDCFVILAPSNPETHLELCQRIFPYGKMTYVDKTFAPDVDTAKAIFGLADKYHTTIQTTSALRYTNVQKYVNEIGHDSVLHMVAWGGGSSFDEYAIHPLELVISCMGHEVVNMMRRGDDRYTQLLLNFTRGRTAVVNVYVGSESPFAAAVTSTRTTSLIPVDTSKLFIDMAAGILDFFDSGIASIDRRESLVIRQVLDMAKKTSSCERFCEL